MQFTGPSADFFSVESSKSEVSGPMKRKLFWLAIALLAAAVYCGLLVTMGDQYLHADLSLGLPVAARTLIAFLGGLAATDRKSTRLNSSHVSESRMPPSA